MVDEIEGAPKGKQTEVETIKMQDGRIVDFAGKRKLLKESITVDGKPAVRLDFRNSETRTFVIPEALLFKFAAHGAEQKLGDETAGLQDVDDAVIAVDELIDRLQKGEWSTKAVGSGLAGTSVLVQALMKMTGKTVEDVKKFLSGKSQADKIALRNNSKLKPIIQEIEAAKASKVSNIDTDAMLGELGNC